MSCNDIYASGWQLGKPLNGGSAISVQGDVVLLRGNRICADYRGSEYSSWAISVRNESNIPSRIEIVNNVVENAEVGSSAILGIGQMGDVQWQLILTNNTILGGIHWSVDAPSEVSVRLVNNVMLGRINPGEAFGGEADNVTIANAWNNLIYGFTDNAIWPTPSVQLGNDTSGDHSSDDVFVDHFFGDFTPVPGGPADGTGLNVFGDPFYGDVTDDLHGADRPETGAWDRGAVQTQEQ